MQYVTSVTPSGIEVAYSASPRRHYRLRSAERPDGSHNFDWREVPSVTNVLGVLDRSGPLIWWAQRIGIEGVLELMRKKALLPTCHLNEWGLAPEGGHTVATSQEIVDLLVKHKISTNHQKDKAANRGVNVHQVLQDWCENGALPDSNLWPENERGYVEGLYQFLCAIAYVESGAEAELMVGSLQHQYAGRFDLVLTLSKPVEVVTKAYPKRKPKVEEIPAGRYLVDLKTRTKPNVYPTNLLQLEAYEAAAVECGYAPTDYRAVLIVTPDGKYQFSINRDDWRFEDFLAVRACYQVMNEREVLRVLREDLDAKEVTD